MTTKEIVRALRCCADYSCSAKCPAFPAGLDCREEMHKEVLALLERLTAENAVLREKVPQWVSVKDRLPDCAVPVLVAYIGYDGNQHGDDAATRVDDWWFWWDGDLRSSDERVTVKITHWMPLPGAPKFADVLQGAPEASKEGEKA